MVDGDLWSIVPQYVLSQMIWGIAVRLDEDGFGALKATVAVFAYGWFGLGSRGKLEVENGPCGRGMYLMLWDFSLFVKTFMYKDKNDSEMHFSPKIAKYASSNLCLMVC